MSNGFILSCKKLSEKSFTRINTDVKNSEESNLNEQIVETLPCTYMDDLNAFKNYRVEGKVTFPSLASSKQVDIMIDRSFLINSDINGYNELFSITINNDENLSNYASDAVRFVVPEKDIKEDGSFSFTINIRVLDPSGFKSILEAKQPLKMKLLIKGTASYKRLFLSGDPIKGECELELFFHEKLSESWIGLDPGTTGSCMFVCNMIDDDSKIGAPNLVKLGDGIIPSLVIIPTQTKYRGPARDAYKSYEPGKPNDEKDYFYGTSARSILKSELNKGSRIFSSIKKMLGYRNDEISVTMDGGEASFSGSNIAHLLIKGLDKDAQDSINSIEDKTKKQLYSNTERIVVAIPNNYTLPKTLDMVRSIKDLGRYKEIRYIYEPEAVLFNYFIKEWASLKERSGETVLVFDMGGATINASLYKYNTDDTTKINVKTLGKIGYSVGGDNIDFALLEELINIYDFTKKLSKTQRREFEIEHKDELLPEIVKFKLNLIKANKGIFEGEFLTRPGMLQFVNELLVELGKYGIKPINEDVLGIYTGVSSSIWGEIRQKLIEELLHSGSLQKYVYDRVEEAIVDIMNFKKEAGVDRIIFSGRSVLFPGIKTRVLNKLGLNLNNKVEWKGLDDEEIKYAVAKGACWYGAYGDRIILDNVLVTSTYGYASTVGGSETIYHSMITLEDQFNENGEIVKEHTFAEKDDLFIDDKIVKFYQVTGSLENNVLDVTKKYKRTLLGSIPKEHQVEKIMLSLDRWDDIKFHLEYINGDKSRIFNGSNVSLDISEEDEAYAFAISQSPQKIVASPVEELFSTNDDSKSTNLVDESTTCANSEPEITPVEEPTEVREEHKKRKTNRI